MYGERGGSPHIVQERTMDTVRRWMSCPAIVYQGGAKLVPRSGCPAMEHETSHLPNGCRWLSFITAAGRAASIGPSSNRSLYQVVAPTQFQPLVCGVPY